MELLINNAHHIGMVDDDLVKKTRLMSECFSTDDELDGSEDNLEESKETKRKEKKRKRSGSFQGMKTVACMLCVFLTEFSVYAREKQHRGIDRGAVTANLISAFVFATRIVQSIFLNLKFQFSCLLL